MKNEAGAIARDSQLPRTLYAGIGDLTGNKTNDTARAMSNNSIIISVAIIVFMIVFIFLLTQIKSKNNNI